VEISFLICGIVSKPNLLIAYRLRSVVNNCRIEPKAQTRIIVKTLRIAVPDFKARFACRIRIAFIKNGYFGNFPIKHEFGPIIVIGTGNEEHSQDSQKI
jgi:hypothetical protein